MRALAVAAALSSWAALAAPAARGASEPLRVFAAASLAEAFREIAGRFEEAHAGAAVELSFAGTALLRAQIEQGAPADVFASADLDHARALERAGLLRSTAVFARNRLVLIVPVRGARVARPADLTLPGVRIVLAGDAVPAGRYAALLLRRLGASGAHGGDFPVRVEANVVSRETSVRAVLAKVALGEADAGFVYATDAATARDRVRAIALPGSDAILAEYTVGVAAGSGQAARAEAFVALLLGRDGQAILRRHGFLP
jgi:molybdate transport system substrate-binding protein